MDSLAAREILLSLKDDDYRKFNEKLIPNVENILGVRLPKLKILAKQIAKVDYTDYLNAPLLFYHEERLLYGLTLGYINVEIDVLLDYFEQWLQCADNWAVVDCTVMNLKKLYKPQNSQKLWDFILHTDKKYYDKPFVIRAMIVATFYFLDNAEYIDKIIQYYLSVKSENYYVNMAIAWGISIIAAKNFEKAYEILSCEDLNVWIKNKAIQKSCESFRLNDESKIILKNLKKGK